MLDVPEDAYGFDDSKNMSLTSRSQILETDIKMSSLSRRACYKCGNVGHYAEVCSSSERLCYNCKQPGELCPRFIMNKRADVVKATRATPALTRGPPRVSHDSNSK
jgi:hypothetical protein